MPDCDSPYERNKVVSHDRLIETAEQRATSISRSPVAKTAPRASALCASATSRNGKCA